MSGAAIVSYGQTSFGRLPHANAVDLGAEAAGIALAAAGVSPSDVDALFFSTFASPVLGGQNFAAAVLAAQLGITRPAATIEAACASGSVAVRQALNTIAAGRAEVVLVVGAEKMTGNDTVAITDALARAGDTRSNSFRAGLTFPGFFALLARSYFETYGVDSRELAQVAVKNRSHGVTNPHAQFRASVTLEEVLESREIADPLRLLDCSGISDGGAAIVIATEKRARALSSSPVAILACEQAGGAVVPERMSSYTTFPAVVAAAERAFRLAELRPEDVDVAEVHDCFSIAEWVAVEDIGLVARGGAPAATALGETALTGRIPVNPSGGLLSKGHPIGATGLAQMIEIAQQLRGEARNQVDRASVGLTHNVGGTGGVASISLFALA